MKSYNLLFAVLLVLLGGCYPQGPEYTEEMDIVFTTYDEQYDFTSKSTYAMPDQIVVDVDIENGDTSFVYMDAKYAIPILNEIDENMLAYGWSKVAINENPDLLMMPAGLSSTTYFYGWWYDWWWGGWYPWWGWYYPPYYPVVGSYTTGTLMMVLADPNAAEDNPVKQTPITWLSASNGIFNYSYDVTRVTDAIEKSFAQSPYLNID